MDAAGTVINAVVTISMVVILGWLGRGRFEALVALAVGARPRAENG
ncbi:MAG TPA: hypothetical protein VGB28_04005 [Actinomycetota bacterium]|jgi:hypothetical protein